MPTVSMSVNGKAVTCEIENRTLLVDFLRENLALTGTHVGCDTSQCGACVIQMDGRSIKSCTLLALQAEGTKITTIEGLGSPERMNAVQKAFVDEQVPQCGYCLNGWIMTSAAMLAKNPKVSDAEIREGLEGLKCRCGTHMAILRAVKRAAKAMA